MLGCIDLTKMVQETDTIVSVSQPLSVPEELFNLTQLANVTLAAGKLSTNNHDQIKEFIQTERSSNIPSTEYLEGPSYVNDLKTNLPSKNGVNQNTQTNYLANDHSTCLKAFSLNVNDPLCEKHGAAATRFICAAVPFVPTPTENNMRCLSSSEDDSVYTNYVHKIFDKRKTRKLSYQSDDSEYEMNRLAVYLNHNDGGVKILHHHSHHTDDSMPSSETESMDCVDKQNCSEDGCGADGDIHTCPECSKKYSTSSNLARHRQTHRSLMDKKARRCPHCDKVYVSMPAFSMHVRTHNQGCECPHCGKRFSRPWLLQGHIRTHTGEKPFQCSICAKAFADKSNLRAHIQTHSNTKPHTCARCGKAFALKSYLYKHEESSCMRNQAKPTSIEKDRTKLDRPDANISPHLPTSVAVSTLSKILKKAKPNAAIDTQKRFKEKLRDKLKNGADHQQRQFQSSSNSSIVMDVGSQKSYIDLNRSQIAVSTEIEQYSRISVIRTALSSDIENTSFRENLSLGFYQESPMDYSPKSKFHSTSTLATSGGFEIGRNYAMVA